MAWDLIEFNRIAERIVGGPVRDGLGAAGDLAVTAVSLGLVLLLARYLYHKQVFIRI